MTLLYYLFVWFVLSCCHLHLVEDLPTVFQAVSKYNKYFTTDCVCGFKCRRLATGICCTVGGLVYSKGITFSINSLWNLLCDNLVKLCAWRCSENQSTKLLYFSYVLTALRTVAKYRQNMEYCWCFTFSFCLIGFYFSRKSDCYFLWLVVWKLQDIRLIVDHILHVFFKNHWTLDMACLAICNRLHIRFDIRGPIFKKILCQTYHKI